MALTAESYVFQGIAGSWKLILQDVVVLVRPTNRYEIRLFEIG